MSTPAKSATAWEVAHVLAEPHRRSVFDVVRQARTPLTRDEVSRKTGINRRLTTFHLDRLADAGLLHTDYARPPGRVAGPGAGRPAKRYAAAPIQLDLSVPPRHYELAARLLTQAVSSTPHDAGEACMTAAYSEGKRVGDLRRTAGRRTAAEDRAAIVDALNDLGYEVGAEDPSTVRLCNCPFRAVADIAPHLICGMNHHLVRGLIDGLGLDSDGVALSPAPPNCCVTVAVPQ